MDREQNDESLPGWKLTPDLDPDPDDGIGSVYHYSE
jgi:hypothetical protein